MLPTIRPAKDNESVDARSLCNKYCKMQELYASAPRGISCLPLSSTLGFYAAVVVYDLA